MDLTDSYDQTTLLGGRVTCFQPRGSYRSAVDAVLLAAAVSAQSGEQVLDIGTGVGSVALCLAARIAGVQVTGLELQQELIPMAEEGVKASGLSDYVKIIEGDLLNPPAILKDATFDHVMANPPYLAAGNGNVPPDPIRAASTIEGAAAFVDWVKFANRMLKPNGTLTLIHRADRLDQLIEGIRLRFGRITLFPLWPRAGQPAKRVIIQAHKGGAGPTRLLAGMALHLASGDYTQETNDVLLRAGALNISDGA